MHGITTAKGGNTKPVEYARPAIQCMASTRAGMEVRRVPRDVLMTSGDGEFHAVILDRVDGHARKREVARALVGDRVKEARVDRCDALVLARRRGDGRAPLGVQTLVAAVRRHVEGEVRERVIVQPEEVAAHGVEAGHRVEFAPLDARGALGFELFVHDWEYFDVGRRQRGGERRRVGARCGDQQCEQKKRDEEHGEIDRCAAAACQ